MTFRSYKMKIAAMKALWFNCRRTILVISSKLHSGQTSSGITSSQLVHWLPFIVQAIAPLSLSVRFKLRDQRKDAIMIARRTKALINKTTTKIRAALLLCCLSTLLRIENAERHGLSECQASAQVLLRYVHWEIDQLLFPLETSQAANYQLFGHFEIYRFSDIGHLVHKNPRYICIAL